MAFSDIPISEESHSPSNVPAVLTNSIKLEVEDSMTTADMIKRVKSIGTKSILSRLEEMEKVMDYLQQQLKENAGCINELGYSFPLQRKQSNQALNIDVDEMEASNTSFLIDHGNGLLPFIQKCLRNEGKYYSVIRWTNEQENEFKIVDPDQFAKMWGMEKRKEGMTKRKLTRSLAYLVNSKKRLTRSTSRTFVYQIVLASAVDDKISHGDLLSSCESTMSSPRSSTPTLQHYDQPPLLLGGSRQQTTVSEFQSKPKRKIPMEMLKKMLRENPKHLQRLIDLQNNQQKQQCAYSQQQLPELPRQTGASQVPTFLLTGAKREFNDSNDSSIDIFNDFTGNTKMPKMDDFQLQPATSSSTFIPNLFIDINNNTNTNDNNCNINNNNKYWDFIETSGNYSSSQCSPAESLAASDINNNSGYFSHSPSSDTSSVCNASINKNNGSFLGQVMNKINGSSYFGQVMSTENEVTANFINPVQQSLMVEETGNLALINPTFCATEPTFTTTDLSAYLTF